MAQVEEVFNPLSDPKEFANRVVDRPAALREVGLFLVSEAQLAFRRLGWRGGTPWPKRSVPNVAGIIRDLETGGEPKDRRFDSGGTGVDTGRLRGGFDSRVDEEAGTITLVNNVPYADDFSRGGPRGPFPGAKAPGVIRRGLARFLRRRPEFREQLGWLFSTEEWFYEDVPERPLAEYTPAIERDVRRIVLDHSLAEGS